MRHGIHRCTIGSKRLRTILAELMHRGSLTTLQVAGLGDTLAPATAISELRSLLKDAGSPMQIPPARFLRRTEAGAKVYEYRIESTN